MSAAKETKRTMLTGWIGRATRAAFSGIRLGCMTLAGARDPFAPEYNDPLVLWIPRGTNHDDNDTDDEPGEHDINDDDEHGEHDIDDGDEPGEQEREDDVDGDEPREQERDGDKPANKSGRETPAGGEERECTLARPSGATLLFLLVVARMALACNSAIDAAFNAAEAAIQTTERAVFRTVTAFRFTVDRWVIRPMTLWFFSGTHQSCTIEQQFAQGVRAFDLQAVRVPGAGPNVFLVAHDVVNSLGRDALGVTRMPLGEAVSRVRRLVHEHPTEFVVLRLTIAFGDVRPEARLKMTEIALAHLGDRAFPCPGNRLPADATTDELAGHVLLVADCRDAGGDLLEKSGALDMVVNSAEGVQDVGISVREASSGPVVSRIGKHPDRDAATWVRLHHTDYTWSPTLGTLAVLDKCTSSADKDSREPSGLRVVNIENLSAKRAEAVSRRVHEIMERNVQRANMAEAVH